MVFCPYLRHNILIRSAIAGNLCPNHDFWLHIWYHFPISQITVPLSLCNLRTCSKWTQLETTEGLKWTSLTLSTGKQCQKLYLKSLKTFWHFHIFSCRFDYFRSDDDHYDPTQEDPEINSLFGGEPDPGWNLSNPSFNVTLEEEEEAIAAMNTPARPPPQTSKIYNLDILKVKQNRQTFIFPYRHQYQQ